MPFIRQPEVGLNRSPYATSNPLNSPLTNQYRLYNTAVGQQAEDYSSIMQGYRSLLNNPQNRSTTQLTPQTYTPQYITNTQNYTPQTYTPRPISQPQTINPQLYNYQPTSDYTGAVENLRRLSETGGYSPEDIANIRERGISPIRSVYGNAQANVNRQRSLQGGYSPNYNAVTAKMARELSDQISNQVTNINAGIAQNVAQNKLSIAPTLASTTAQENVLRNQYGRSNIDLINEANRGNINAINEVNRRNIDIENLFGQRNTESINEANRSNIERANQVERENVNIGNEGRRFGIQLPLEYARFNQGVNQQENTQALEALHGMQGLYGTTPAMSALFGGQALSTAQLQNIINQQGSSGTSDILRQFLASVR